MELILRNISATINPWVKQMCRAGHELPLGEPTVGEYRWCISCWEERNGPISDGDRAMIRANVITQTIIRNNQENREMAEELFQLSKDYDLRGYGQLPQDYEVTMAETFAEAMEPTIPVTMEDTLPEEREDTFLWPVYDPIDTDDDK